MELTGEAATAGGGGATSVHHVLSSGGLVSPPFRGGDLGFVRGDVKEDIGVSRGFPTADNKAGGGAKEGRGMAAGFSRYGPGEGRYSAPRHIY